MLKKAWNDPVWSKVIASVILAVGTLLITIFTYFLNWWPTIGEDKILSDIERRKESREYNSEVPKTIEPPASKAKQPTSVQPSMTQPSKEKGSGMRSQAIPPTMPLPSGNMKQPEGEKICQQSMSGLTRQPKVFVAAWRSILKQLQNERTTYDLLNLFKVWGRIPVGLTGKDLIQEATYTLNCLADEGQLKMEKLGATSTYWGENFENQTITFLKP